VHVGRYNPHIVVNRFHRLPFISLAVWLYAASALALWLLIRFLVDRAWPATLIAFGPRWLALLPALPLVIVVLASAPRTAAYRLLAVLTTTTALLLVGVMDFRLDVAQSSVPADLRIMTHNVGESAVTADSLDELMRSEEIDVAALQECPFYDLAPARLGWHFYYAGDLCLVSRFTFTVLAGADQSKPWRAGGRNPMLFAIHAPGREFQLLIVHFQTIRGGLDGPDRWGGARNLRVNRDDSARESGAARAMIREAAPLVVAGDFNLPVESAIYAADWRHLTNAFSRCGRGFGYTKFTSLYGIRIDHVLTSAHFDCTRARVLRSPYGGDHQPLVVDLRYSR
jgi:endonuclease/exonuclease/phosphatase (EEP) superfamily protein YafD